MPARRCFSVWNFWYCCHCPFQDRATFRRIVLKNAFNKRKMYEALVESVPMLQSLDVSPHRTHTCNIVIVGVITKVQLELVNKAVCPSVVNKLVEISHWWVTAVEDCGRKCVRLYDGHYMPYADFGCAMLHAGIELIDGLFSFYCATWLNGRGKRVRSGVGGVIEGVQIQFRHRSANRAIQLWGKINWYLPSLL